jgi:hypothetical protein
MWVAVVLAIAFPIWRLLDGVIDRHQEMHGVALIGQIFKDDKADFDKDSAKLDERFDRGFSLNDDKAEAKSSIPSTQTSAQANMPQSQNPAPTSQRDKQLEQSIRKYNEKSIVKPVPNSPVPQVTNEYLSGYYTSFWNFLLMKGIVRWACGLFFVGLVIFICRKISKTIDRKKAESELEEL